MAYQHVRHAGLHDPPAGKSLRGLQAMNNTLSGSGAHSGCIKPSRGKALHGTHRNSTNGREAGKCGHGAGASGAHFLHGY